jgi:cation transport ATPase
MVMSASNPNAVDDSAGVSQDAADILAPPQLTKLAKDQPNTATAKKGPSVRLRYITGGVFFVLAVVAFIGTAVEPGEQPSNLILVLSAACASVAVLWEGYSIISGRLPRSSPFVLLPVVGGVAISAAAFMAGLSVVPFTATPLLAAAPALAVVTLLMGNAFSLVGTQLTRRDSEYLYPRSTIRNESVRLGEIVSYKAGEVIAIDGRIERGCVAVDERRWSPVSEFRIREENEVVYAGSEVLAGAADIVALATARDASLSQLQAAITPIIEESQQSLESEDLRASRWSALVILFLSVAAGIFWQERSPGYIQALLATGTVALFGSVCGMSALLYGLRRSLVQRWVERGYLLATAESCKQLAAVASVECDPSRCGDNSLLQAVSLDVLDDRLSQAALCEFLSALLGRAEDPVLLAAGEYCRRLSKVPSVERVVDLREYLGRGICGTVHGVELSIGSEDFLVERGIMVQPSDGGSAGPGEQLVLVAIDDDVVARVRIARDQAGVIPTEGATRWHNGVHVAIAPGVARTLGEDTLLVRGKESDLVGQVAAREVSLFDISDSSLRRSTVVAFTPELAPLEGLLYECRAHIRSVDRFRLLVGFGGLVVLVAAFAGATTPLVPLLVLMLVGGVVRLSSRGN